MMSKDILEEQRIWKTNSKVMYNLADFHILDWPSFTCQWLPNEEIKDNRKVYKIILGTHTEEEDNKLIIGEYSIWNNTKEELEANENSFALNSNFEIIETIDHEGDVNRARFMPQNPSLIATRSSENESYIYNEEKCILTLKGHTDEGYGVSWNKHVEGRLLTCSFDKTICCWDVNSAVGNSLSPIDTLHGHSDKVEDVSWHPRDGNLFASVGDDKKLLMWDYRQPNAPQLHTIAHDDDVNCVNWHPITEHLLLTGGSDELVNLWDRRKLVNCLHAFHTDNKVYRVEWSPLQETLFLSAGLHCKVHVWDLDKIGDDVLSLVEEDHTPPELVMIHSGHIDTLTDIDWHPVLRSTVASVDENNMLNIWQIKDYCLGDD